MKKKFLVFLSAVTLLCVGVNTTACSDDDDDNKTEKLGSKEQGEADGAKFAEAYNNAKANGYNITTITELMSAGNKYRESDDKVYKSAFIAKATGATDLAEEKVNEILGSNSASTVMEILKLLNGNNAN